ncbi:MAG TPA: glycosyltransferase, partial [Polyangiaceae bacterium]
GKAALLTPDPRVQLEGFVQDVRPAYRDATIVAVPLPLSAGTNIKLLEAMACGRAVVSTQSGCRGLGLSNANEIIVAELEDFAAALLGVLNDEHLQVRLARAARKVAEQRFGWDAIAAEALSSYAELTEMPVTAKAAVV